MNIFDIVYEPKVHKLEQVSVRLVKEKILKYNEPIVNSKDAIKTIQDFLGDFDREAFVVLCLNTANIPTNFSIVHLGTLDRSLVHPREIFKTAILSSSNSIICFHNHPSGTLKPSDEDLTVTNALVEAGKVLGINVLDHVIVTNSGYHSILHELTVEDN